MYWVSGILGLSWKVSLLFKWFSSRIEVGAVTKRRWALQQTRDLGPLHFSLSFFSEGGGWLIIFKLILGFLAIFSHILDQGET